MCKNVLQIHFVYDVLGRVKSTVHIFIQPKEAKSCTFKRSLK